MARVDDATRGSELAAVGADRASLLVETLGELDRDELNAPSMLPAWSRLTIVCHLRYGHSALARMTHDALAMRPTSYYPEGRARQRPVTLRPLRGESPAAVVAAFRTVSAELDAVWRQLNADDWTVEVTEPTDNPDLGTVPLGRLAMSRLLEVDVHGTDLGIGFPDWSDTLVDVALPTRLAWLSTRRTNHRKFDDRLRGSWLLDAQPGPRWLITVNGDRVDSRPANPDDTPTATIRADARDMLAVLLGRPTSSRVTIDGDLAFGRAFTDAFPGP